MKPDAAHGDDLRSADKQCSTVLLWVTAHYSWRLSLVGMQPPATTTHDQAPIGMCSGVLQPPNRLLTNLLHCTLYMGDMLDTTSECRGGLCTDPGCMVLKALAMDASKMHRQFCNPVKTTLIC